MRIRSATCARLGAAFSLVLLGAVTPVAGASAAITPPTVSVPASIDGSGAHDVTAALQRFLSGVADGSVVRLGSKASYRVDGTLLLDHRHNLTIDGNGARVFAKTRGGKTRSQWYVLDGSNIVFRDLTVQGANPQGGTGEGAYVRKLEHQHGFQIDGANGVQLDHVTVSDVYGDFVYVGRDGRRVASRNVWVHDSQFMRNGRQGISVVAGDNVVVERNHFTQTRRATIDLEPNARSWHVSRVFVLNNVVGPGRLLFVASHGQGPVDDVMIAGNRLQDHSLTIDVVAGGKKRRSDWVVRDNTSDTTVHARPMRFAGIDGLLIQNNRQRVDGAQPAVALSDDCGVRMTHNDFGPAGSRVKRSGKACTAPLAVPRPAPIPGRASTPIGAAAGPGATPGARPAAGHHGIPAAAWVVLGIVAALIVFGAVVLVRRRRASV
jgi:hypothetical protein